MKLKETGGKKNKRENMLKPELAGSPCALSNFREIALQQFLSCGSLLIQAESPPGVSLWFPYLVVFLFFFLWEGHTWHAERWTWQLKLANCCFLGETIELLKCRFDSGEVDRHSLSSQGMKKSGSTCLSRQQNRTSSCCIPRIEGECTWMLKKILYRKVKVCEVKGRPGSRSATDWELTVLFTLSLVPNTSEQLDPIRSEPLITWLPTADILAFITVITNTCVYLDLLFQSSLLLPGLFFLFCWVLCYITVGNVLN